MQGPLKLTLGNGKTQIRVLLTTCTHRSPANQIEYGSTRIIKRSDMLNHVLIEPTDLQVHFSTVFDGKNLGDDNPHSDNVNAEIIATARALKLAFKDIGYNELKKKSPSQDKPKPSDYSPTVMSLIKQNSLYITGNTALIKRCLESIDKVYNWQQCFADERTIADGFASYLDNTSIKRYKDAINDAKVKRISQLKSTTLSKTKNTLYTLRIEDSLSLTAHVRTHNGSYDKVIYIKDKVNPKRVTHSVKALIRALDQSSAFFICQNCNNLIDANFKTSEQFPRCIDKACRNMIHQPFDASTVDRVSSLFNKDIRIDKLNNKVVVSIGETSWPHPHEPKFSWQPKILLPPDTSPHIARAEAQKIQDNHVFDRCCEFCGGIFNVDDLYNNETCYSCAIEAYGVVY